MSMNMWSYFAQFFTQSPPFHTYSLYLKSSRVLILFQHILFQCRIPLISTTRQNYGIAYRLAICVIERLVLTPLF